MKAGQIFRRTMCFAWMKLGVGAITVLLSGIALGACVALGDLIGRNTSLGEEGGVGVAIVVGLIAVLCIYRLIYHYIGYIIKAGHVAVIGMAVTEGKVPEHPYQAGKDMVKSRFVETNVFFVIDRLVSGAVSQIQAAVGRIGDFAGDNTAVSAVVGIIQIFIGIVLKYVDECCLGYVFYKKDENAFKSASDCVSCLMHWGLRYG